MARRRFPSRGTSSQADVSPERMQGLELFSNGPTDLNILRLAVAEMVHGFDTPAEVTIEMAVRTAKKYGGTDSGRFVNGVLAQLYRDQTPAIR